jgi:hypothetical protein
MRYLRENAVILTELDEPGVEEAKDRLRVLQARLAPEEQV